MLAYVISSIISCVHSDNRFCIPALLASRDTLHNHLEKLRDEQRYMENDLSNIQIRWHSLREEKVRAANMLQDVKKAEEELDRLAEEKSQLELDEKVVRIFCFKVPILHDYLLGCIPPVETAKYFLL